MKTRLDCSLKSLTIH